MSCLGYQIRAIPRYSSSAGSVELFPDSIKAALDRIEVISNASQPNERKPSIENVEWAKRVLLRVLPRHYLVGAEIDAFQCEIHVNWEHGNKRVTLFLPSPNRLRVYCEQIKGEQVQHHMVPNADDPWALSGVLRWMFS